MPSSKSSRTFIIGTRSSALAQWQARSVEATLRTTFPHLSFVVSCAETMGDTNLQDPLAALAASQPGVFTSALEAGLASGAYDIVVHSLKDMPTSLPAGLALAAVGAREDPRDALLLSANASSAVTEAVRVRGVAGLPPSAIVGTSSVRREALLARTASGATPAGVRGNLATRLRKLDAVPAEARVAGADASATSPAAPTYDALLLALAGIRRLGWEDRVTAVLDGEDWPWGVGQGALGLEVRAEDAEAARLCLAVVHPASAAACLAERAFMNRLQGGCQVPIGAYTWFAAPAAASLTASAGDNGAADIRAGSSVLPVRLDACGAGRAYPAGACTADLTLRGTVLALDGSAAITAEASRVMALPAAVADTAVWRALQDDAEELGVRLARRVLAAGAEEILGPLTAARAPTYSTVATDAPPVASSSCGSASVAH